MAKWKVLVNENMFEMSSNKIDQQDQFKDIKNQVYKKMGVNKKTIVKPNIYIINKIM